MTHLQDIDDARHPLFNPLGLTVQMRLEIASGGYVRARHYSTTSDGFSFIFNDPAEAETVIRDTLPDYDHENGDFRFNLDRLDAAAENALKHGGVNNAIA